MAANFVYERTTADILKRALKFCRIIDPNTPLEAKDRDNAIDALNGFIKYLQTKGFNLWREKEALIPLVQAQQMYRLGSENGNVAFDQDDFVLTALDADYITNDVLINLTTLQSSTNPAKSIKAASSELGGYNPATSLQGWAITNGTAAIINNALVLTNITQANASYDIETVPGQTYILQANYEIGTDTGANFTISDIDGVIISTTLIANGIARLEFIARQKTTQFIFENQTAGAGLDNTLIGFDYINKANGDKIGVFLNDGSLFYSNVIYLSPFEIAAGLPSDADLNNVVYSYTNIIPRPLDVVNARYRGNINATDIPTTSWTRDQYFEQPDKASAGTTTKWYYSPQLTSGELYIWQPAQQKNSVLAITYIRPLFVTSDNIDATDFPSEWFDLLCFGTAYRLVAEYDVPQVAAAMIATQYTEILESALGFDNNGDIFIEIDYQGRR